MGTASTVVLGADVPAGTTEFFESRIRPLFHAECIECHGLEKQKGGLRLDYREALRKGGKSGPALIPGDSRRSLLMVAVRHGDGAEAMPPDRPRIPESAVADLAAWIDAGANDPRDTAPTAETAKGTAADAAWDATFERRRDWWSFRPVSAPKVPSPKDAAWSAFPVDRFLRSRMEQKGVAPAGDTDRRTWLRRATFLLTGLPPTPEESEAFVADAADGARERVLDRLLASPRFGETWARHWMDLVRFAETHGSEGDPDIPDAWRYRDYLVRAFNRDVPLDRLIREHVAGDLLPDPRTDPAEGVDESRIGTAHFRLVEHGFNPVDTLDEQMKVVDSQIDVVSKAFQGLTTSCARCHHHKFDPIADHDYAALHGVFASVRATRLSIDLPERLRVNRDPLEALRNDLRRVLGEAWERAVDPLVDRALSAADPAAAARTAIPGESLHRAIQGLEKRLAELENEGRRAAADAGVKAVAGPVSPETPRPLAAWTFDADGRDSVGTLNGTLEGGAVVREGRLVLDGRGAFLQTPPLGRNLVEKTLEAWVFLADTTQRGGGVVSVETLNGGEFDALVFGESEPRRWMAGSEGFARTRPAGGKDETANPETRVHVAVVYRADGTIALYRDGEPYGAPYRPSGLKTFTSGGARVLLGRRHTGGGSAFLAGAVDEARLFDRALTEAEIRAEFRSGPGQVSREQWIAALPPERRMELASAERELAGLRTELGRSVPDFAERLAERNRWKAAFDRAVADDRHPLSDLRRLGAADTFTTNWTARVASVARRGGELGRLREGALRPRWDFTGGGFADWFRYGANPPESFGLPGEFAVEPSGPAVLGGLLPVGVYSHRLSQRHNGVFASPRFRVETDRISVRVVGGKGARVRLIPDGYPIGQGNIFPQSNLNSDAPTWVRLDTAYRKGSMAYLEFATADDVTSRDRSPAGPGGRSFFGVTEVVFHDAGANPESPDPAAAWWDERQAPADLRSWGERLRWRLRAAVSAWRTGSMSADEQGFLDAFLRAGLLSTTTNAIPEATPLLAEYRRLEDAIPVPRRVPGVVEADAADSPLYSRGDPRKPLRSVRRGYLQLVSRGTYRGRDSGRLQLAEDLTASSNPLTARVMANRLWYHVFGRGLVGTLDNFGRLGDVPTHPELLDHLAVRLVAQGWSTKAMLRELMLTRAFGLSSDLPAGVSEVDPANTLLTHARVRRLEAEPVRDGLLFLGRHLDLRAGGPGDDALAEPARQRRRSVYLTVRRNFLNPFLETFDQPRPFTTLGKREVTNVPGQSLALLNDPFVLEQATGWAAAVCGDGATPSTDEARVGRFFAEGLGRPATAREVESSRAYLADLRRLHALTPSVHGGKENEAAVWRDFAQSVFNLKEFLYLR